MFLVVLCWFWGILIFSTNGVDFDHPAIYQITEPVDLAEGPTWDGRKNILFFVDIYNGRVFSYNYYTRVVNSISLNDKVTPVIPAKKNNNLIIVGLNRSVVAVEWDGSNKIGRQKILTNVSKQFPGSRFNDGKADKKGRLWFGTMGLDDGKGTLRKVNQGVFYKITKDNLNDPTVEIAPVNISNGLTWNAANNKLYYIDSPTFQVVEFDYDNKNGIISNHRITFDLKKFPELTGVPDGMTIDESDNLWIALYGGGSIIKVDPKEGNLLKRIALPARDVSSVIWGGPNLDILFVTTSRIALTEAEKLYYPAAGSVFAITNLKTKGNPVFYADIIDLI